MPSWCPPGGHWLSGWHHWKWLLKLKVNLHGHRLTRIEPKTKSLKLTSANQTESVLGVSWEILCVAVRVACSQKTPHVRVLAGSVVFPTFSQHTLFKVTWRTTWRPVYACVQTSDVWMDFLCKSDPATLLEICWRREVLLWLKAGLFLGCFLQCLRLMSI